MTPEQREAVLARIRPAKRCRSGGLRLIIEAVFEDRELKANVSLAAQKVVGPTR
jgi:3-hydroxyacyl-CoA dehydrogenase/enoyl-CoA hydratase/3-hydroxybutyryl-CoA epimerase